MKIIALILLYIITLLPADGNDTRLDIIRDAVFHQSDNLEPICRSLYTEDLNNLMQTSTKIRDIVKSMLNRWTKHGKLKVLAIDYNDPKSLKQVQEAVYPRDMVLIFSGFNKNREKLVDSVSQGTKSVLLTNFVTKINDEAVGAAALVLPKATDMRTFDSLHMVDDDHSKNWDGIFKTFMDDLCKDIPEKGNAFFLIAYHLPKAPKFRLLMNKYFEKKKMNLNSFGLWAVFSGTIYSRERADIFKQTLDPYLYGVVISGSHVWSTSWTIDNQAHEDETAAIVKLNKFRSKVERGSKGTVVFVLLSQYSRLSQKDVTSAFKDFTIVFLSNGIEYNLCYDPADSHSMKQPKFAFTFTWTDCFVAVSYGKAEKSDNLV